MIRSKGLKTLEQIESYIESSKKKGGGGANSKATLDFQETSSFIRDPESLLPANKTPAAGVFQNNKKKNTRNPKGSARFAKDPVKEAEPANTRAASIGMKFRIPHANRLLYEQDMTSLTKRNRTCARRPASRRWLTKN